MPKTKTYTTWKYNELSREMKEKVINNYCDINVNIEWWEHIHADAKQIGLKITSFDLDRNRHAKGYLTKSAFEVAELILENHGKDCETYQTAQDYLSSEGEEGAEPEFLRSLLEDYSIILQKECDYLVSDEAIEETIIANDYDFNEHGKIA